MSSLGICVGASGISLVLLNGDSVTHWYRSHEGNPKSILLDLLDQIDLSNVEYAAVTGRKFKELMALDKISEPEAIEYAFEHLDLKGFDTIVSAGGENFIVYSLDSMGKITRVQTGNKCASGTGEFFLQQISRMNLNAEEAVKLGLSGVPHSISGRCSVFCKSDCTHALNKGVLKENVVAGLCRMMANKIVELLRKTKHQKVLLIGGTSQNAVMVKYLRDMSIDLTIPSQANYFEALGAAYGAEQKKLFNKITMHNLFLTGHSAFDFHPPLSQFINKVEFKSTQRGIAKAGDECILGLDVGSTTTKSVILRLSDNAILASIYLRTNGDPVGASIQCYRELHKQLPVPIHIVGLGVTGSGRQIAGLHALTNGIVNEIIAHATAAAYFDTEVNTIFEIGGQDAKYTYLVNGVASDYAMNEACSAGTGSFLEESARESLGIGYTEIGDLALQAKRPPNFNDQCAAFISSDIKNAAQEGINKEDIIAGLVYSICLNYIQRVKGSREVGNRVFMQGGVCYNHAVPVAMAALTGKNIIVPPDPGLMGAFGVALEIKKRLELGLLEQQDFSLTQLIDRQVINHKPFTCKADLKSCDRNCEINLIEIEMKKYPFGGACNRYYNIRQNITCHTGENDLVSIRQKLVFEKYATLEPKPGARTIGINKSFLANTFYPLFYNFFTKLGMRVILPDKLDRKGTEKVSSSFCFPAEISHGLFQDLINKNPDYIFLPHITELEIKDEDYYKRTCVLVQAESYFIKQAFKEETLPKIVAPVISFAKGLESAESYFVGLAAELGFHRNNARDAYQFAVEIQREMWSEFQQLGENALQRIKKENKFGMILFGRSYNAFAREANLGIPHKFASRGRVIIPFDFLPLDKASRYSKMYWAMGNLILRAAEFVSQNPLLFGCFITNFSCGPDSFLVSYFRNIMGVKPSLTLELDSHSADAGIDTRVEAALDIMERYSQLQSKGFISERINHFVLPKLVYKNNTVFVQNGNGLVPIRDPRVNVVLSSMGEMATKAVAAVFRANGIRCQAMPPANMNTLKIGRAHTSCKECLPLIVTTGTMLDYLAHRPAHEITLFFMPFGSGPCRQGQYHIFQEELIRKLQIPNVAVLTANDEKSYNIFGNKFYLLACLGIIIAENLETLKSIVRVLAINKKEGLDIIQNQCDKLLEKITQGKIKGVFDQLHKAGKAFRQIKLIKPLDQAKIISVVGEIFVRRDEFSKIDLTERLEERGFVIIPTESIEYLYYTHYLTMKGFWRNAGDLPLKLSIYVTDSVQQYLEKRIKRILSDNVMYDFNLVDIKDILHHATHLVSEELLGEAILTIGSSLRDILDHSCGVISIGPFGCMPSRISEAILTGEMNLTGKETASGRKYDLAVSDLPYLVIETDGNMFPPIIQSRLEIFMLQADRIHEKLMAKNKNTRFKDDSPLPVLEYTRALNRVNLDDAGYL